VPLVVQELLQGKLVVAHQGPLLSLLLVLVSYLQGKLVVEQHQQRRSRLFLVTAVGDVQGKLVVGLRLLRDLLAQLGTEGRNAQSLKC
jgi:hypothetical protein